MDQHDEENPSTSDMVRICALARLNSAARQGLVSLCGKLPMDVETVKVINGRCGIVISTYCLAMDCEEVIEKNVRFLFSEINQEIEKLGANRTQFCVSLSVDAIDKIVPLLDGEENEMAMMGLALEICVAPYIVEHTPEDAVGFFAPGLAVLRSKAARCADELAPVLGDSPTDKQIDDAVLRWLTSDAERQSEAVSP